jgi:hypothetical protein
VWRRRREQPHDEETVSGLIRALMRIEAKLDEVLWRLREDDEEEEGNA